ncbi:MAG: aminopeptidase P family protein [Desulfuromonadales bacterium]|nr:aminopeptidase P family protein [Desulfuromonadales bacterium]
MQKIPARGFSKAEFTRRTERAQRLMREQEIDALLFTTEPNVRYFSGFYTQFWESPTRPWFLVVPSTGIPIAVIPEIGLSGMATTWIEDIRTWPAPRPEDDGISLVAEVLRATTTRFSRVGVTLGHESHLRLPAGDFQKLTGMISSTEIVDSTPLIRSLRNIKSAEEIEKISYVCELTSAAFEALPDSLRVGETERENCKRFRIDLLNRGADNSPYLISGSGPDGYDSIIMGPTERVLTSGDVLIIDTGTIFDGYFTDFDRNFAFGQPTSEVCRAYDVVYAATEAGFKAARPGATTSDLWRDMWSVLEAGGALGNDVGRMGHGLGMQLTEWPSNTPTDNTLLEAGMVITLEPGMTFAPGKQMVHEENLLITEDGAKMLTRRAPAEIPVIDIS